MHNHDNILFPESFRNLLETADLLNFNLVGSYITFDSGFDSEANKVTIGGYELIPVIRPNQRNTKDPKKLEELFKDFNEAVYKERYKVERTFAWQDVYKKLVTRYERLQCTHLGFKYLAYTMINFRSIFKQ